MEEYEIYMYIRLFFTFIGIIFYLLACVLFELYFKAPNLIKTDIFTYIFFHTFKNFLGMILPKYPSEIFTYCLGIIEFFLILSHLNKCFTSKNISESTNLYELKHRYLILIIYAICSFPFEVFFKLIDQYIFSLYILNLILSIIFFRYINIRMNLILDYLKGKRVMNSSIPDIYLPYVKANFYFVNFNKINNIFNLILILVIIYHVLIILNLFFDRKILNIYLIFLYQEIIYIIIIIANLMYFYCLNRDLLIGNKMPKEETTALNKFRVIDVDIQHEEDENILDKKNQQQFKDKNNKGKGEEQYNSENKKLNEESEKLKE